jgi:hypothetical protein
MRSPEALFEAAARTREMIALTERFLDGKASEAEVESWARAVKPHEFASWIADDLHTCLYNIDSVRREDVELHLAEIRRGFMPFDDEAFAKLRMGLDEVARRTQRPTMRFYLSGLGAFEGVQFASLATGRPFWATISHLRVGEEQTFVATLQYPPEPDRQLQVIQELFDTLVIDSDDALVLNGPPLRRWRLLRLDDNANTFEVAMFTGYAKARAVLAEYQAKLHKQTYWLEEVA